MLPVYFGQNDIIHTVTGLPSGRHKADVVVEDYQGLFNFSTPSFPPLDAVFLAGVGYRFNLRNLFRNYSGFNMPLPAYNQMLPKSVKGNIIKAKVRVQSVGTAEKWEATSGVMAILNGGMSEKDFAKIGNQFFGTWSLVKGPFLTWQPKFKRIEYQSPEHLYWLQNISSSTATITVRYTITHFPVYPIASLTPTEIIIDKQLDVVAYSLACIPVSPAVLATYDTAIKYKNIASISVQVLSGIYQSEIRIFYINDTLNLPLSFPTDTPVYFKVLNSFGTYDTIMFYGAIKNSTETERYTVDYERRKTLLDVEGFDTLTVNTGNLDQDWLQYIKQLLFARKIYHASPSGYREVILETKNLDTFQSNISGENATLEFRYVELNSNYSNL